MATVAAVFVKPERGRAVVEAASIECVAGVGIDADANAGAGSRRQVLLVSEEAEAGVGLRPGALWENITTRGIDVDALPPATELAIGREVAVQITEACDPCSVISRATGVQMRQLKGRRGMLAVVLAGGTVAPGDPIRVVRRSTAAPRPGARPARRAPSSECKSV